jgi:predicted O-linked N-acetylglucosamine transferase (SPINDLY family)
VASIAEILTIGLGHYHAGRVAQADNACRTGLSFVTEGIAETESDYIARAVALAEEVSRLARLRHELRGKLMSSSLANPRHFTAELEDVYRLIWRDWCNADDR